MVEMMDALPKNYIPPRQFPSAQLLRLREPYHFQRQQVQHSNYPRPPQPNTNQPNARTRKESVTAIGQWDYWNKVFQDYLDRRKQ